MHEVRIGLTGRVRVVRGTGVRSPEEERGCKRFVVPVDYRPRRNLRSNGDLRKVRPNVEKFGLIFLVDLLEISRALSEHGKTSTYLWV